MSPLAWVGLTLLALPWLLTGCQEQEGSQAWNSAIMNCESILAARDSTITLRDGRQFCAQYRRGH